MSKLTRDDPVIFHYRNKDDNNVILPRGGVTVVFDPSQKLFGVAVCSKKDTYNRRLGRMICANRLSVTNRGVHLYEFDSSKEVTIENVRKEASVVAEASLARVKYTHGYNRRKAKTTGLALWMKLDYSHH